MNIIEDSFHIESVGLSAYEFVYECRAALRGARPPLSASNR